MEISTLHLFDKKKAFGGFTYVYLYDKEEDNLLVGLSICSPHDNFSRAKGRQIAVNNFTQLQNNIAELKAEGEWNGKDTTIIKSGEFITGFNVPGKEIRECLCEKFIDDELFRVLDFSNVNFLHEKVFVNMEANMMMNLLLYFHLTYSEAVDMRFPEHAFPEVFFDKQLYYPPRVPEEIDFEKVAAVMQMLGEFEE